MEMSAAGAALIGAAVLLRLLTARRLPKGAFVALWWIAALRLLTPAVPASRFSLYTLLDILRREAAPPAASAPSAGVNAVMVLPPAGGGFVPPPAAVPEFPVWEAVWLAGAVLLGVWFLANYLRWRRRFQEALPAENCPSGAAQWTAVRRPVRVRVSDRIAAPLTYGLVCPVILLPKTMDLSDGPALRCVLAHEGVHIRRLDGMFKLVLAAALCVHWFNPAAWVLYVLANRDMELRCDEEALRALGEDRRELYALTLIRLAECQSVPLCGFSRKSGMEERIIAIMKFKKKSALAWAAALLAVACVTTVFATSAMKDSGKSSLPPADIHAPAELENNPSMAVLQELRNSVYFEDDVCYFTIPETDLEGRWNIWITGRYVSEDGTSMSVHYLENESEKGEWVPGQTYSFVERSHPVDELLMEAAYGDAVMTYDLLPNAAVGAVDFGSTVSPAELPAVKEDMPKGAAMIWPSDSMEISAAYSDGEKPHSGVDIGGLSAGDPVYAAAGGTVKDTGFDAQNGNYILLEHGNGMETYYAHCQTVLVETGTAVEMGETIAKVGSTGMATGPHLHFEIMANGEHIDPAGLLKSAEDRAQTLAPLAAAAAAKSEDGQYPVNKNGQTYAANESLSDTLGNPDLVGVIASNGEYGYVSLKELNSNCKVAWGTRTGMTDPDAAEDRSLPVYNEAGDVIGEFVVKAGKTAAKPEPAENAPVESPSFSRNSKGETYGTVFDIPVGSSEEPDLLAAVGTNGENGYIATADSGLSWSPDLNLNGAYLNWVEENNIAGWMIPLYDQEHNVIGEFECGTGNRPAGGKILSYEEVLEAKRNGWPNSMGSDTSGLKPVFSSLEEAKAAVQNGWPEEN